MSEMKDRLVCAIWMALRPGQRDEQSWHRLPLGTMGEKSLMMSVADKALEAMREPTEGMCEAALSQVVFTGAEKPSNLWTFGDLWKAAIDEARK